MTTPMVVLSDEQAEFEAWCPYRGAPDPRVVWAAAWAAARRSDGAAPLPLSDDQIEEIVVRANAKVLAMPDDQVSGVTWEQEFARAIEAEVTRRLGRGSDGAVQAEPVGELRGLDTAERVRFYEHDFYPLSNFSAFNLRFDGNTFSTSEHAYHWQKFHVQAKDEAGRYIRDMILDAPSAHEAFKIGERNKVHRRADWDVVKVDIMRRILRAKVDQHEYVRRKLLATGARELVEDSWRDDFWGWGPNRDGANMLGKLWMELRAELLATKASTPTPGDAP